MGNGERGKGEEREPEKKPGEGEEFHGKTYLYIKTNPLDDGSEPLPAGLEFWMSPDITLIEPNGTRGGEAIAEQKNTVEVIVTNKGGIDAVNSFVEVYVADPSTSFTPSSCKKIFGDYVTVPHYNTAIVTAPWVPASEEGGHKCILARICLTIPPDCYKDWSIFDVVGDRHVAQRNIFVVSPPAGTDSFSFGFQMVNPKNVDIEYLFQATPVDMAKKADLVRSVFGQAPVRFSRLVNHDFHLAMGNEFKPRKEVRTISGKEHIAGGIAEIRAFSEHFSFGVMKKAIAVPAERKTSHTLTMKNQEIRQAVITLRRDPGVQKGEFQVVQIEQIDTQTKKIIGGICLFIQH